MKRLLVSMDEDRYEDLRRFAFEKKVPMAELVRHAIEETFEDQLDVMRIRHGLEEHAEDPSGTMTIQEYMKSRGIPSRRSSKSTTRTRRIAS